MVDFMYLFLLTLLLKYTRISRNDDSPTPVLNAFLDLKKQQQRDPKKLNDCLQECGKLLQK